MGARRLALARFRAAVNAFAQVTRLLVQYALVVSSQMRVDCLWIDSLGTFETDIQHDLGFPRSIAWYSRARIVRRRLGNCVRNRV